MNKSYREFTQNEKQYESKEVSRNKITNKSHYSFRDCVLKSNNVMIHGASCVATCRIECRRTNDNKLTSRKHIVPLGNENNYQSRALVLLLFLAYLTYCNRYI